LCRRKHRRATAGGELHRVAPYPAVGSDYQHGVTRLRVDLVDGDERGDAGERQCGRLREIEAVRLASDEPVLGHGGVLGPGSVVPAAASCVASSTGRSSVVRRGTSFSSHASPNGTTAISIPQRKTPCRACEKAFRNSS